MSTLITEPFTVKADATTNVWCLGKREMCTQCGLRGGKSHSNTVSLFLGHYRRKCLLHGVFLTQLPYQGNGQGILCFKIIVT